MMKRNILNFVDKGDGEIVLLLAGLLASTRYWTDIIAKLKTNHRVIAFDQLGFGLSPKPDKHVAYSIEENIQSYYDSLEFLKINQPITVVGYSSSAILALAFTSKYPQLVKKLVLITPPIHFSKETAIAGINKSFKTYKLFLGDSFLKPFFRIFLFIFRPILYWTAPLYITHVPSETARDVFRSTWKSLNNTIENIIINQNVSEYLREIKLPIKILYAESDNIVIEENLIQIAKDFPNIQLEKLDCTHQIPQERPEAIVDSLE